MLFSWNDWPTDPTSNTGSLLEAFDVLSRRLRLIEDLPLKVSSVQPLDSGNISTWTNIYLFKYVCSKVFLYYFFKSFVSTFGVLIFINQNWELFAKNNSECKRPRVWSSTLIESWSNPNQWCVYYHLQPSGLHRSFLLNLIF